MILGKNLPAWHFLLLLYIFLMSALVRLSAESKQAPTQNSHFWISAQGAWSVIHGMPNSEFKVLDLTLHLVTCCFFSGASFIAFPWKCNLNTKLENCQYPRCFWFYQWTFTNTKIIQAFMQSALLLRVQNFARTWHNAKSGMPSSPHLFLSSFQDQISNLVIWFC